MGQICPLLPPPSTLENRGGRPGRRRRSAGGPGPRGWPGRGGNEGGRRGRMIPPSDLGKRWPAEAAPRRRVAVDGGEHGGGATERGGGREVRGNGEGIEKARVPYLAWARAQRGRVLRDGQRRQGERRRWRWQWGAGARKKSCGGGGGAREGLCGVFYRRPRRWRWERVAAASTAAL